MISEIHIKQAPGEFVNLFVNGELVAEICCGVGDTPRKWLEELRVARTLRALPKFYHSFAERLKTIHNIEDHNHPTPDKKVIAFLLGFADGVLGVDVPHPANADFSGLNLRMQRDYSPAFSQGYEAGRPIHDATKFVEDKGVE